MVKFLDTTEISAEINNMLKSKDSLNLYLVCPYLKICDNFKERLEDRNRFKLETKFVFGKTELQPGENEWINSLRYARLHFYKNLHAKCYMDDSAAIITSMNLYEYSQVNNREMGIIVYKEEDPEVYNEILEEVKEIIRNSDDIELNVKRLSPEEVKQRNRTGHCIRCGEELPLDPKNPYCDKDLKTWKRYSDSEYIEKNGFCHICGESNESSFSKPVCKTCYSKNKELFK